MNNRPVVCIQGLGFVGTAMSIAIASARDSSGSPLFNVIGMELPTPEGQKKSDLLNSGHLFFQCHDEKMLKALEEAHRAKNLTATASSRDYSQARVTVVSIPLDVQYSNGKPSVCLDSFRSSIRTLGQTMPPGSLVIVSTTVPPGTCEKVVVPELQEALKKRGLPPDAILVAHSYERVMPGKAYFDSIVNYWHVYAGYNEKAANACAEFLSQSVNVADYPLTRLPSMRASETGKILENSYRAVNIAFMEEWGRFAEEIGVDLFEVISAIRMRPTHANMRQPGFGVGGYCLTKDPLFAQIAAKDYFGLTLSEFPFSSQAVKINNAMPLVSLNKLESVLGGSLAGKRILLLGVSYRQDVGDTRYSPAEIFITHAKDRGAEVLCHDPLVHYWPELALHLPIQIPAASEIDAAIFAVPHEDYIKLDVREWLNGSRPIILDANNVLTAKQRSQFKAAGCKLFSIGRGDTP